MSTTNLADRAMLVRLTISSWTGRKHDRRGDAAVDAAFESSGAGRFSKLLVGESDLKAIQQIAGQARAFHYENSLPWLDDGTRLLAVGNFGPYSKSIREYHGKFDAAADELARRYDAIIEDGRTRQGRLFNASDYPRDIRGKYSFEVSIMPVPAGSDFRVLLADDQVQSIRRDIESRVQTAVEEAQADLYRRLAEKVGHMAEVLADPNAVVRESVLTNLSDLVALIPRLSVVNDPQLSRLVRDVDERLLKFSVGDLRYYQDNRTAATRNAEDILAAMEGLYGTK